LEPPVKILIVDDDDDVCRELLKDATEEDGVEIMLADGGL